MFLTSRILKTFLIKNSLHLRPVNKAAKYAVLYYKKMIPVSHYLNFNDTGIIEIIHVFS